MARTVKPEIVARIATEPQGVPGMPAPAPEPPQPSQLDVLQLIVDGLNEDIKLGDTEVPAIDALLLDRDSVQIEIRKVAAGEVWIRVDKP